MKAKIPFLLKSVMLAGWLLPLPVQAGLTVHEWGTFTVLQGADGSPVRWYLPWQDQHPLPAFVHRGIRPGGKALAEGRALARMETPVLYFYPDEEMKVSVKASLPSGGLSEWFPNALTPEQGLQGNPKSLQWIGHLIPPNSPLAGRIPTTDDEAGRHYGAAREVPQAWLFQSALPQPVVEMPAQPSATAQEAVSQLDRVIFYRGAADLNLPLRATATSDHRFELHNQSPWELSTLYAVQTSGDQVAWTRLDGLSPAEYEEGRNLKMKSFAFSQARAGETGIPALRQDMAKSLEKEGLTPAEAAAMIETWRDLWFGEAGTRVLAILPVPWVNEVVPLQISPKPAELVRVYVARLEILTPAREQALSDLLTGPDSPEAAAPRLKALGLGRFTQGALERVKALQAAALEVRLGKLLEVE